MNSLSISAQNPTRSLKHKNNSTRIFFLLFADYHLPPSTAAVVSVLPIAPATIDSMTPLSVLPIVTCHHRQLGS